MNLNTGDYLEAGYFETLSAVSGGVDEYRLFYETVSAGSVSFHIVAAPCSPPFPPSGKSGFRVRRYWATLWVLEVDCADNGTWQNLGTIDLPASPTWGNARGEMERFQRENGYNTLFTKLNWRQFNDATATWKPWVGMGCASTPAYWSTENLRRLSGSGFDFVSGTGQC